MSTLLNHNPASTPPSSRSGRPELEQAIGILKRHAHNPSAFLTLNADTLRFQMPGVDGFIGYRPPGRRHLVQLGGVFSADGDKDLLLSGFRAMAGADGRHLVTVQLL